MPRRPSILDQVRALDPLADHQRIVFLSTYYDFAFDTTRALEFALFRTFCVPSISAILDRSGEFGSRPQKRYDDTDLIINEMMENGYDSERGHAALRRMNQLHRRWDIANDDYLYVLSTFIFEPIRWNARFGWRPMCDQERLAMFHFWREVGRRMNIRDIPADYAEFERFNVAYEREHFRFSETNARIGAATRDLFLSWFPRWTHFVGRPAIYAMMDDPILAAFGFPRPSRAMRWVVSWGLAARARVLRLLPPRRRPNLHTTMAYPSYPDGYRIEDLGPPRSTRDVSARSRS